jgi:hypothetical protein
MKHRATSLLLAMTAALTAPGAVPVRRLNRYEYNCTVRDLLGVDFRANDDFPADNFSYGFDNNAATLTVTPALLAKYLDAAKKIARCHRARPSASHTRSGEPLQRLRFARPHLAAQFHLGRRLRCTRRGRWTERSLHALCFLGRWPAATASCVCRF